MSPDRLGSTKSDGRQLALVHAIGNEHGPDRAGALGGEKQITLRIVGAIGVALDGEPKIGMESQDFHDPGRAMAASRC